VIFLNFRLDTPHFEETFVARITGRFDENVKSARDQDRADYLNYSHVTSLFISARAYWDLAPLASAVEYAGGLQRTMKV
jgi:hypothetical protein